MQLDVLKKIIIEHLLKINYYCLRPLNMDR